MRDVICALGRDSRWLAALRACTIRNARLCTAAWDGDLADALALLPPPSAAALLLVQIGAGDDMLALARQAQALGWRAVVMVSDWLDEGAVRETLALGLARDVWRVQDDPALLGAAIARQLALSSSVR